MPLARPIQLGFSRWYSAEAEPASKQPSEAAKEGEAAKPAAGGQEAPEVEAEAALKKDLETKTKEALDWKVCSAPHAKPSVAAS